MKISYAIPVCTEHAELEKLLLFLTSHIDTEDEIVVQCDQGNTTPEVYQVIDSFKFTPVGFEDPLKVIEFPLNGHFANFKNNLKEHCTGDWIFQIDADELPHEGLIANLKIILNANPILEMLLVPRVNTVDGLTQEHIQKWGWRVDDNGWVNYPDSQYRIFKNKPNIKYKNKVHEVLEGYSSFTSLPESESYSLYHPKSIIKQEKQNNYYTTLTN
jgi:glycosyltransferase involved in cell wall biosynthesis